MGLPIATSTLLSMAAPFVGKIIREIAVSTFTEENLEAAKKAVIDSVFDMTGRTPFNWDDRFAQAIINDLCKPAVYQKYGDKILDAVETVITASTTPWDDRVVMPVIEVLRDVAKIPDGED